jgi:hypothetical protein
MTRIALAVLLVAAMPLASQTIAPLFLNVPSYPYFMQPQHIEAYLGPYYPMKLRRMLPYLSWLLALLCLPGYAQFKFQVALNA